MIRMLDHIRLTHRFFILGALGICLVLVSTSAALKRTYDLALDAKKGEIKHLVEAASSTVRSYIDRAKKGELTEADAKRLALDALRDARFEGGNFFFLERWDGVSLLTVPASKIGVNRMAETDAKGNYFIKEIIGVSKQPGGGFLTYWLPFPGQTEPDFKVSYIAGFPEWQWALGAGLFITSVNTAFRSAALDLALIVVPLLALFGLILFGMARGVSKLLLDLTSSMQRVAEGDLEAEIPNQDRTDEIGQMAVTVAGFRQAAREKQRLEFEAGTQRESAEAEKRRAASVIQDAAGASRKVVDAIGKGLTQLSAGDLTSRIDDVFSAEYQKLHDDFNATAVSLQEAMSTITDAAAGISSGSDQIARATGDLSRRTEQQAANLEETAAALNIITNTVKAMATGANEAAQVVATARGAAEASGVIVTKAVGAMGEIAASSNQIGDIIGVIDEIAFQTNLLALNAGVEAARAGEAGRGFAVVAAEVRALAQRSAEAAKEIKTLISASSAQVENGVDLVGKTGSALKDIIEKFASMETLVRQMSQSSQEQATGLVEINTAMTQMDHAVQQNAAFVEESTAAAQTLMGDSRSLTTMINRFKTGTAPAPPAKAQAHDPKALLAPAKRSAPKPAAPARPAVAASLQHVAAARSHSGIVERGWEEF